MSNPVPSLERHYLLIIASIITGASSQAVWALNHSTHRLGSRILTFSLGLYLLMLLVSWFMKRFFIQDKKVKERFPKLMADGALFFSSFAPFFLIPEPPLRWGALAVYLAWMMHYLAHGHQVLPLLYFADQVKGIFFSIYNNLFKTSFYFEVEEKKDELYIEMICKDFQKVKPAHIKEALIQLYYDLPNEEQFQNLVLDLTATAHLNHQLESVLVLLEQYRKLFKIDQLRITHQDESALQKIEQNTELSFIHPYIKTK